MERQVSIWEQETFFAHQNIIIIGSGLVGLWCAWVLKTKHPLAKITIVEKGIIPTGASTRNAGFACFGSPTEMIHDASVMGEAKMWATVGMRYRGIEKIRDHFGDNIIDYDNCGGYECLTNEQAEHVADHIDWLNAGMKQITGLDKAFGWCNEKLQEFGFDGFDTLIENKMEGGLHSGKLVQALMQKVQGAGVTILTGLEVTSIKDEEVSIQIQTANGMNFFATKVLYCTNAFSSALITNLPITPARGQILVTSPIENLKMRGTFHYDEGYYYFRNLGNRVLIGGARNKAFDEEQTTELSTSNTVQQELEFFLSNHILPGVDYSITNRWSGIMGLSENKEPVIKQVSKNSLAVIACNGMGVALSPMIAEQVAEYF
jgi:gamma-glutamylputrescine oxidase